MVLDPQATWSRASDPSFERDPMRLSVSNVPEKEHHPAAPASADVTLIAINHDGLSYALCATHTVCARTDTRRPGRG